MLTISWEGIRIDLSYTGHSYCSPFYHLEVKATERLPITETGYRSHFMHPDEMALWASPEAFVRDWLDETAKSTEWKDYRSQSRQLSLF